jgi:hypothetical protein
LKLTQKSNESIWNGSSPTSARRRFSLSQSATVPSITFNELNYCALCGQYQQVRKFGREGGLPTQLASEWGIRQIPSVYYLCVTCFDWCMRHSR